MCVGIIADFCILLGRNTDYRKIVDEFASQNHRLRSLDTVTTYSIRVKKEKVKERIVLREIHLRTTGRHLSNGITQCYLLPDRGGRPAFTPTGQVGTRFIDPVRMKG